MNFPVEKSREDNQMPEKKPSVLLSVLIVVVGLILILMGVMRGDPGRFLGGDTPILTFFQILGGLYLFYWVSQYLKGK